MDILKSELLASFAWLDHGFGTRAAPLSQDGMATLKQVHSARVLRAIQPGCAGDGDGLVTNVGGLTVSVRTADCLPVLLLDPVRHVVAAVHAGWRGTAAGIVGESLKEMHSSPGDVFAAIGPGIGPCCYHVGEEVAMQFGKSAAGCIDLPAANRAQLIAAGVPDRNIDVLTFCTFCDAARFHSFRRDKSEAGRMISYIRLADG